MTVETEVANLTTAVDALTAAVNVQKATLDAAVSASQEAEAGAETAEDNAQAHRSAAAASAVTAAAAASVDLSGLNTSILDYFTLVDMCWTFPAGGWLEDTHRSYSTETLCGAWLGAVADETAARAVDGATTTDFYLNTTNKKFYKLDAGSGATEVFRGNTARFPREALITAESGRAIIWERVGADLVMWYVKEGVAPGAFISDGYAHAITAVAAKEGKIHLSLLQATTDAPGLYGGALTFDFRADSSTKYRGSSIYSKGGTVPGISYAGFKTGGGESLVHGWANDVAMTVLPDAPIDPATGHQIPTRAVGTAGGLSVIRDDDTVADSASTAAVVAVVTTPEGVWWSTATTLLFATWADVAAGDGFGDVVGSTTKGAEEIDLLTAPEHLAVSDGNIIIGGTSGLQIIKPDYSDLTNSMSNFTTKNYLTGWTVKPEGAFLADADTTDLVGAELVSNVDFATDISGWSDNSQSGGSIAWNAAGGLDLVTDASGNDGIADQSVSTVIGKTYVIDVQKMTGSANVLVSVLGLTPPLQFYVNDEPEKVRTFIAEASSHTIRLQNAGTNSTATVDTASVKLADADRSANRNGLIINGTVPRESIYDAGGLALYGPFDAGYLSQPYLSGLDFGTTGFAIPLILEMSANAAIETVLERDSASTGQRWTITVTASGMLSFTVDDGTTTRTATGTVAVDDGSIKSWVFVYNGHGGVYIYDQFGAVYASATGSALLTLDNASAVLNVGTNVAGTAPLENGRLALVRPTATVVSTDQIAMIMSSEKPIRAGRPITLGGSSDAVTALSDDYVGTSDGLSRFKGPLRTDYTTGAVSKIAAECGFLSVR